MQQPATFEKYYTRDEERRLFATVRKCIADILARRDLHVMVVMRQSGGRVGSIAGLNVGDAQRALSEHKLRFTRVKGGRPYEVHANRVCRRALRELLRVRLAQGYKNTDPNAPLIMSRNHRRISVRSLQARVKKWTLAAAIFHGTPHVFRHTLGKRIVETSTSPEPLRIAQRVLGHRDISTTTIYTAPDRDTVREAMEMQA
jgi:site-specific recombinase XerC